MTFFRFKPCQNCCGGLNCIVYEDDFERASPGVDWMDVSGSSSITDGEFTAGTMAMDTRGGCDACTHSYYGSQWLLEVDVDLTTGTPRVYFDIVYEVDVTGGITPDITGAFWGAGRHNGRAMFLDAESLYPGVIYYDTAALGPAYVLAEEHNPCYVNYPTETITVTGIDAAGDYEIAGRINGYLYYDCPENGHELWYSSDESAYIISISIDEITSGDGWWLQSSGDIIAPGSYAAQGTASGTGTVTADGDAFWLLDGEGIDWVGTYRPHGTATGDASINAGNVWDNPAVTYRYFFWKIWKDSGKVKIQQWKHNKTSEVSAGSVATSTVDVGDWATFRICSSGGVKVLDDGEPVLFAEGATLCNFAEATDRFVGLGSGTFDNYSFEYHALEKNGCKRCNCDYFSEYNAIGPSTPLSLMTVTPTDETTLPDLGGLYECDEEYNDHEFFALASVGYLHYGVHEKDTGFVLGDVSYTLPEDLDWTDIWWYRDGGGIDPEGTYLPPYPNGVYRIGLGDATGFFTEQGVHNDETYYQGTDVGNNTWFLYYSTDWGRWCLGETMGDDTGVILSGTLAPDIAGKFFRDGLYDSKPAFTDVTTSWMIWWCAANSSYIISTDYGDYPAGNYWEGGTATQVGGTYTPVGTYTGTGTIADADSFYLAIAAGETPSAAMYNEEGMAAAYTYTVTSFTTAQGTVEVDRTFWNVVAGSWSFSSDPLVYPLENDSIAITNFEAGGMPYHVQLGHGSLLPMVENWTVDDQVKLIGNWVDEDNYSYGMAEYTTDTPADEWVLSLHNVVAGADTELLTETMTDEPYWMRLCVTSEWIAMTVYSDVSMWSPIEATGHYVGVGVGTATEPRLQYFKLADRVDAGSAEPVCNDCGDCDFCANEVPPHQVSVALSGFTRQMIDSDGAWCIGESSAVPYPDIRGKLTANGTYNAKDAYTLATGEHLWWSITTPTLIYVISQSQGVHEDDYTYTQTTPYESPEDHTGVYTPSAPAVKSYRITMTGSPTPDATGSYVKTGTHGGQDYYVFGSYFLWYHTDTWWYVSGALGNTAGPSWRNSAILGTFQPYLSASGTMSAAVDNLLYERGYGSVEIDDHTPCDCTALNTTFVLDWETPYGCTWNYYDDDGDYACHITEIEFIPGESDGLKVIERQVYTSGGTPSVPGYFRPTGIYADEMYWHLDLGSGGTGQLYWMWYSAGDDAYVISMYHAAGVPPATGGLGSKGNFYWTNSTGGTAYVGTYTPGGSSSGNVTASLNLDDKVTWDTQDLPPEDAAESGDNCRDWDYVDLGDSTASLDYCYPKETLCVGDALLSPNISFFFYRNPGSDYNGEYTYTASTLGDFIYYNGANWILTPTAIGTPGAAYWQRATLTGSYTPQGTATGTATVTSVASGSTATITAVPE